MSSDAAYIDGLLVLPGHEVTVDGRSFVLIVGLGAMQWLARPVDAPEERWVVDTLTDTAHALVWPEGFVLRSWTVA